MFALDESFLDMVGLSDMPEEQKADFLAYAQDQLEVRIGEKMSQGLSESQLDEFERIIDNDKEIVNSLLTDGYQQDQLYQVLVQNSEAAEGSDEFLNEYATAKWLDKNCPQYQDIIQETLFGLRDEIAAQRDEILESAA